MQGGVYARIYLCTIPFAFNYLENWLCVGMPSISYVYIYMYIFLLLESNFLQSLEIFVENIL